MRFIMLIPSTVWGWEDAQVIGFILTHNPVLQAYRQTATADNRHGAKRGQLRTKAGRRCIGQVVRNRRLAELRLLGAGHRGIEKSVHCSAAVSIKLF